jgi:ferredoxin
MDTTPRLAIDRIRCDGYGMCAELLPELIELDDWGYPVVRSASVPADLEALARRAVAVCPVLAIKLTAEARRATVPARAPVVPQVSPSLRP